MLYHRIAERNDRPWIENGGVPANTPSSFCRQLHLLKRIGCRFFTFRQLVDGAFPETNELGIVVTFDDGFADNFRIAQPILDAEGVPAVFFVSSGMVEASEPNWDHQICWYLNNPKSRTLAGDLLNEQSGPLWGANDLGWALRHMLTHQQLCDVLCCLRHEFGAVPDTEFRGLYCTWQALRDAAAKGHEVGSHGANHLMRHTLTQQEFTSEIVGSKLCLETQIQRQVGSFSFPFNSFLFFDEELCRQAGYTAVATVEPGRLTRRRSLLDIPRRTVFRIHDRMNAFNLLLRREEWRQ